MEWLLVVLIIVLVVFYRKNNSVKNETKTDDVNSINNVASDHSTTYVPENITVQHIAPEDRKAKRGHKGVHCPKCRSLNCEFLVKERKGFSVGKAAVGGFLTGGIGTMAGFAGGKGKKELFNVKIAAMYFNLKCNAQEK